MPELPEVEVICQGLAPHLQDQRIVSFATNHKKLRLPVPAKNMVAWITGKKIADVSRRAKYIVITMENSASLVIHLGMTGRLCLSQPDSPLAKHDHIRWQLDNRMEMRFNDTRRFGSVQVLAPDEDPDTIFAGYGPDPFWDSFTVDYLAATARNRNLPVKNFLMDNRVVTGIGNIYASETLFAAGINPAIRAGEISREQWAKIISESRKILREAIRCGGTTISDYVNSGGEKGYFQTRLRVYGRKDAPCPNCRQKIEKIQQGGRATFFCPECQAPGPYRE